MDEEKLYTLVEAVAEKLYTLVEAVAEIVRRECAENRHTPTQRMGDSFANPVGTYFVCDCGQVRWMREEGE